MPEQVEVVLDPQVLKEVCELLHEEVLRPEACVALLLRIVGGVAVANLIVENDGDSVSGQEVREGEEVVVRDAWPAVQTHERTARFDVAEDLVPCLRGGLSPAYLEINCALGHLASKQIRGGEE